jgi:hypothetical protein
VKSRTNKEAYDERFSQRPQCLQAMQPLDQNVSVAIETKPHRRLLPVDQDVFGKGQNLAFVQSLEALRRHIDALDGDLLPFEHQEGRFDDAAG